MPIVVDKEDKVLKIYDERNYDTQLNGSVDVGLASSVEPWPRKQKRKTWVRTPGYRDKVRLGQPLPDNAYTAEGFDRDDRIVSFNRVYFPGDFGARYTTSQVRMSSLNLMYSPDTGGSYLSPFDLNSRLVGKARSSSFSLPITLVEGHKTVAMIAQTAISLANCIRDLRRGNLNGFLNAIGVTVTRNRQRSFNRDFGRDASKAAANAWLAYRYGWKPLLKDVKDGAEALAEAVSRNGESMTSSVKASTPKLVTTKSYNNVNVQVSPRFRADIIVTVTEQRRGVWRFKPNSLDLPGLFGLLNPLEVAWEVIPFSFVADWFLPIGGYLSSLDAPLRFTHVGGSTGYKKEVEIATSMRDGENLRNKTLPCTGNGKFSQKTYFVERAPIGGIPEPKLSEMRFSPHLGAVQVTSAIALLRQQASRLGR